MAVAGLWQGAAIAVGLVVCLRLMPRVTAAQRFATWAVAFVTVTGLPFLPLLAHRTIVESTGSAAQELPKAWLQLDSRWALAIAAVWLAAAIYRAGELALQMIRLRNLWRSATVVEDAPARLQQSDRSIEICSTRALDRPSVIGFFRPRILIPEWLLERLTEEELEQVILHEAEHLHRRDDWSNLLQKICLVIYPLNPALAWMDRRLGREREMACDEGVVRRTQAPRAYAACLTSLAERGREHNAERAEALSLAAWRRRPELVDRVHSILRRKQAMHPVAARALMGTLVCGLVAGSVELAQSPQVVAFVAAQPVIVASAQPSDGMAPRGMDHDGGFRAISAKAILPGNLSASGAVTGDAPRDLAAASGRPAENTARLHLIDVQKPASDAAQEPGGEYVVLTAWEQVEGRRRHHWSRADYDAEGATNETTENRVPAQRMVVTQLIFKVQPVSEKASAATKDATSSDASKADSTATDSNTPVSTSGRRVAVPFENGWLVFQL